MSRKSNKSNVGTGFAGILAVAVGAGLGFLASKIFQSESEPRR